MACCDDQRAFDHEAVELAELANDPTLADCCRRDMQEQAQHSRLVSKLTQVDKSQERGRLQSQVIRTDPGGTAYHADDELESDSEGEAIVRLRALRVQQLQDEMRRQASLHAEGHGSISTVPESRFMGLLDGHSGSLVCHLTYEGSELGAALDEHLTRLAHAYTRTRFVRTLVSLKAVLPIQFGLPRVEALATFKDGVMVGKSTLERFGAPDDLREEYVTKWLRQLKVLQGADKAGESDAQHSMDESESGEEGEQGDWREPCADCGRRYPHEHIRSVTRNGIDEDSDAD